jgi:signal peptidase I
VSRTGLWGLAVLGMLLFVSLVGNYGFVLSKVNGTSMRPTLHDGDRLLVNKIRFLLNKPKIGDVITFKDPSQENRFLVKRVIGVPGDIIEIKDGFVYRNGKMMKESYIETKVEDGDFGPIRVEEDTVFVMGDNRHRWASRDSRSQSVGLVPYDFIDGKVEFILWRPSLSANL